VELLAIKKINWKANTKLKREKQCNSFSQKPSANIWSCWCGHHKKKLEKKLEKNSTWFLALAQCNGVKLLMWPSIVADTSVGWLFWCRVNICSTHVTSPIWVDDTEPCHSTAPHACMDIYIYVYTNMHACMYIYMKYIYKYIQVYVVHYMHIDIVFSCTYTYIHVNMYIYMGICVCAHICINMMHVGRYPLWSSKLQCVAVCCSVLQCVAVCRSVLQCVAVCCSVQQCVAVCCGVLRCVACVAVYCSVLQPRV